MAPLILRLSDSLRSWNSASRCKMISNAPPASPALIMLTYSRLNALGHLAMPSESVEPPSISSQTSIRLFLKRPGLLWFSRIRRLRKIGRPASCRIESCRVKAVRTLELTPPIAKARLRPGLVFSEAAFFCFLTAILVTK